MIRKVIAGALIVVVISTSSVVVYGNPVDSLNTTTEINTSTELSTTESSTTESSTTEEEATEIHKTEKEIELNNPTFVDSNSTNTKKVLISGQIFTDTPVYLGVYMVLEDKEEVILEPEIIKPSGTNLKTFFKELTDLKPGDYKMEFTKEGEEEPFEVITFKLNKWHPLERIKDDSLKPAN